MNSWTENDIIVWFTNRFGHFVYRKIGNELNFNCPWCKDTGSHFYINVNTGFYHCHRGTCKRGGNFETLLEDGDIEQTPERVIETMKSVGYLSPDHHSEPLTILPGLSLFVDKCNPKFLADMVDFPINKDSIEKFHLGYDNEEHRIIFPFYTEQGDLIGYTARTRYKDFKERGIPKYKNSYGLKKQKYLYGCWLYYPPNPYSTLVIVEGPKDVIRLHSLDIPAVGICGSKISSAQISLMQLYENIVILPDHDKAGEAIYESSLPLLHRKPRLFWAQLPRQGTDPANSDKEDIYLALRQAKEVINFISGQTIEGWKSIFLPKD
jgi:DNA primase